MFKFFSKENTSGKSSDMTDVKAEEEEFLKMNQVIVLVSSKYENRGERFDWSIKTVADGKYVM